MQRQSLLLLLAGAVVLAGCAGGGGADGTADGPVLTGTASTAELSETTRSETAFVEVVRRSEPLNTTVRATIQGDIELSTTRRVNVTTRRVEYHRELGEGSPAVFSLYSVPAVKPFERADLRKNPASASGPDALAGRVQTAYALSSLGTGESMTVTVFGNETTATRYRGDATRNGTTVDAAVTVVTVRHEGDYVSAVAVVPTAEAASVSVETLLRGVTH